MYLYGTKLLWLQGEDCRQLLHVKVNSTRSEVVDLSINRFSHWQNIVKYSLTQNMRVLPQEIEFTKFLLNVGDGILNDIHDNLSLDNIPKKCITITNEVEDIVADIYGHIFHCRQYRQAINYAILSARNVDVNEINETVVNLLDETTEKNYTSIDSTENCDNEGFNNILLPEYLNILNPSSLPPYELRLRINSIIMIIRNLSISEGLCNGTRLMVLELANNILKCEILTGDKKGDIVFINRITLYSSETDYPFIFIRRQFPIKLAFAMTINKAQGQTFKKIRIDLRNDVFSHGHLNTLLYLVYGYEIL
ncbi:uncharacterized protein LOC131675084 [Phymastichus coffea]|uniref:uncharacterized protein LOC131675084 n=1 Tax=Phymastichus coffea TaxID=108790 RepID=UPI00273C4333|nr:uncharacterized protein LOC131675084 [Phymastichus coffea]